MRKLLILAAVLFLASCADEDKQDRVINVVDGDTFDILRGGDQEITIRLYGLDCPESSQPYGDKATQWLQDRISQETVEIKKVEEGNYGRTIAKVYHNDQMINELLVQNGLAWVYNRYCDQAICDDWQTIQQEKRQNDVGLWQQSNPEPPWEYRD
jgi:endonuclease YncB( thermonuclease family)